MARTRIEYLQLEDDLADYIIESITKGFKVHLKTTLEKFNIDGDLKKYMIEKHDFPESINKKIQLRLKDYGGK